MRYKVSGTYEVEEFFDVVVDATDDEDAELKAIAEVELSNSNIVAVNPDFVEELKVIA